MHREAQRKTRNFVRKMSLLRTLKSGCSRRCLENADVSQSHDNHSEVNKASSFDEQVQTLKLSCEIYFFTCRWICICPHFAHHGARNCMSSFKN